MGKLFFAGLVAVAAYFLIQRFAPKWDSISTEISWHWIAVAGAAVIAFCWKSK